uniref:Uncharacterized protein n=1 Tax=Yersinia pestis TaxID=632 RepID=Q93R63_YERPE|nr:hypothetical protein [Yersinia pestis EV76-CN]
MTWSMRNAPQLVILARSKSIKG